MFPATLIVVLIKDFDTAKSRLAPALTPSDRRALAEANATRALRAALQVAATIAVCGSPEAAALAGKTSAAVVLETHPTGQNAAAALGLEAATARGANAALLLSSDLPLVSALGLRRLLRRAARESGALALAAPALGRQGTNALFLRPPSEFKLHFGEASLLRFADEARRRKRTFVIHEDAKSCLGSRRAVRSRHLGGAAENGMNLELLAVEGLPEIHPGDDLGALVASSAPPLHTGDILVIAQKVVSKSEGRLCDLSAVIVGERAQRLARNLHADSRFAQVILDESVRIVRDTSVLIVETRQGFICANAGVDRSNVPGDDTVTLLPIDCDGSASVLSRRIAEVSGARVGVIVSDTWGRPWRLGITNMALGISGVPALIDYRGRTDDFGRRLEASVVAVADELAAAAELVMGKTRRVPAVIIRGFDRSGSASGQGRDLVRPAELDLFR